MSRVTDLETNMTNYAEFKSAVFKHGFSVNNFYDVRINWESTQGQSGRSSNKPLFKELSSEIQGLQTLMRLYTDETSMPGIQMATGEYRINNSPQLKYAYGSVFSEVNMSFMMDADSIIKTVFDVWTNFIYNYSGGQRSTRLRSTYRDDYAVDIDIIKYESATSSHANRARNTVVSGMDESKWDKSFKMHDILPDKQQYYGSEYRLHNKSGIQKGNVSFRKAVPVQATKLFKAFPSNIASVPLALGDTSMNKLSIGFEYESHTTTAITGGKIGSGVVDIVNGGGERDTSTSNRFSDNALGDFFSNGISSGVG